jgi:D-lactate dehydrogenase (cytochrome)
MVIKINSPDLKSKMPFKIAQKKELEQFYSSYLTDESRMDFSLPKVLYFPINMEELIAALQEINSKRYKITISGGRTGVVGGAVCRGTEAVILLDRWKKDYYLDKVKGELTLTPNWELREIENILHRTWIYPPDPTEKSATIGGTVATNASGARSFFYGASRNWIKRIKVVLYDGKVIKIERGKYVSQQGQFLFEFPAGEVKKLNLCDLDSY